MIYQKLHSWNIQLDVKKLYNLTRLSRPSLFQILACGLLGAKAIAEQILAYC